MSVSGLITSSSYFDEINTSSQFGTRDLNVNIRQALQLDQNKRKAYRVTKIILSAKLPNVYSYGNINNTTINVTKNGATTWDTIVIPTGIYSIGELNTLINQTCDTYGYWANNSNGGFILSYNPATEYVYVQIDSTQLASVGQLGIDFGVSQMYLMLGFTLTNSQFITDSTFTATNYSQIDFQGTYVDLYVSCIQSTRLLNGNPNNSVLRLPITTVSGQNEIIFPSNNTGTVSSYIPASISSYISNYKVKWVNGRGNPAVFMYGESYTEIELVDL